MSNDDGRERRDAGGHVDRARYQHNTPVSPITAVSRSSTASRRGLAGCVA